MFRLSAVLAFLLATAMTSVPAAAQRAGSATRLPVCDIRGAEAALKTGNTPDFRGCFSGEAARVLMRLDYQVRQTVDQRTTGVERGIVTGHTRDGRLFILRVSSGAGYPPRSTPTPAPTPTRTPLPTPTAAPVSFTISGPSRTIEGGDLVFRILRRGDDGNRYRLALSYSHPGLLDEPPSAIIVEPSETAAALRLRTVAGPDEEGTRVVTVRLTDVSGNASIGRQNAARGIIDDQPVAPSYSVAPDGPANRGEPIRFVVSRSGALEETDIEYGIAQGNAPIGAQGARRILHFAEGSAARPITVLPTTYDQCGDAVSVTLLSIAGDASRAAAPFTAAMPTECEAPTPTGTETLGPTPDVTNTGVPPTDASAPNDEGGGRSIPSWWFIPALLILSAIGFVLRTIKRWFGNKDDVAEPAEPAPETEPAVTPAPTLAASCKVESGISELLGDEGKMQVWPGFKARVTVERGMASVPDPLPETEEPHG